MRRKHTSARETGREGKELVPEGPCPWQPLGLPTLSSCPHCLPGMFVAASGFLEKSGGNPHRQQMQALMLLLGSRSHNALGETAGWEPGVPACRPGMSRALATAGPPSSPSSPRVGLWRRGHTDAPDMGRSSRQLVGCSLPTQKGG